MAASRKLIGHMNTLLEYGANVDATSKVNGQNNYTALHEESSGHIEQAISIWYKSILHIEIIDKYLI